MTLFLFLMSLMGIGIAFGALWQLTTGLVLRRKKRILFSLVGFTPLLLVGLGWQIGEQAPGWAIYCIVLALPAAMIYMGFCIEDD